MSRKRAASESELAGLHSLVANYYSKMLKEAMDDGIPLPSADVGNILRLLHASNITATPDDTAVNTLRNSFGEQIIHEKREENRAAILTRVKSLEEDDLAEVI